MYGLTPYMITKNLIEIPIVSIQPLILLAVNYYAIGLDEPIQHFDKFYIILFLMAHVATSFGNVLSASFDNADTALASCFLFLAPTILFGGLFVNLSTLPTYIRWMKWTSPANYCFQALVET